MTDFKLCIGKFVGSTSIAVLPNVVPCVAEHVAISWQLCTVHDATVAFVQAVFPARQTHVVTASYLRHSAVRRMQTAATAS